MKIGNVTAALTMAGLLAATPVLAQSSLLPQPRNPDLSTSEGVAGGSAGSSSKDAAAKQKAQNLTPSTSQDSWESGKQK